MPDEGESHEYRPGQELLERYMEAQAHVFAESTFLCFALGQAATAVAVGHPELPEVVGILQTDAADLSIASEKLLEVVYEMVGHLRHAAGLEDEPQPAEGREHDGDGEQE